VEVLEHEQERLDLALSQEQTLHGVQRPLAAPGRIERRPLRVLHRHIEQREDCRYRDLQRTVQRQQLASDLLPDLAVVVACLDLEVGLEQADDREVRRGLPVGDRARLDE